MGVHQMGMSIWIAAAHIVGGKLFESERTRVVQALSFFGNDPSAGSPTETLLRLLLPLNDPARVFFRRPKGWLPASVRPGREARSPVGGPGPEGASPTSLLDHSSEIATGGVYKGQGRSRRSLVNCAYGGFLVRGKHLQSPVPFMNGFRDYPPLSGQGRAHCIAHCSARAAQDI